MQMQTSPRRAPPAGSRGRPRRRRDPQRRLQRARGTWPRRVAAAAAANLKPIAAGSGGEVGHIAPGTAAVKQASADAAAATANLKLAAAVAGSEDGHVAPDVVVAGAGSAAAGTAR